MKTIKRILAIAVIACAVLFIVFNFRQGIAGNENVTSNDGDTGKVKVLIPCINTVGSHLKDFGKAVTYINDYVSDPLYKSFATDEGGWVEISRERLPEFEPTQLKTLANPHCGLLCYFLYNLNGVEKFKIGHNYVNNLYAGDEPPPTTGDWRISDYNYHFTPDEIVNPLALSRKISTYSHRVINQDESEPFNVIRPANDSFVAKIHDPAKVRFAAGFIHEQQIRDILTQNDALANTDRRLVCKGLRIYWGYDYSARPYAIRMVIFGIDDYGYNILTDYTGKKNHIYQRSWPPDEAH